MSEHEPSSVDAPILHLALPEDWDDAVAAGEYRVSTRGTSLESEGFIHCSFPRQVETVANLFYGDLDALVVLHVDPSRLESDVVVEPPFDGAPDRFPHVYGPIPVDAVVAVTPWRRDTDRPWGDPPVAEGGAGER